MSIKHRGKRAAAKKRAPTLKVPAARARRGGRPKGSPNKVTGEARETFRLLLEGNAAKMQQWLDRIAHKQPARAFELLTRLAEFVIPRLARTQVAGDEQAPLRFVLSVPPKASPSVHPALGSEPEAG